MVTEYVQYIGLAHQRGITADEWKRAGVADGETVFWGAQNGFSIPKDQFTDRMLEKAIYPDPNFVIVGADTPPEALPHDMTPQQASQKIDMTALMDEPTGMPANGSTAPSGSSTVVSGGSGHDEPGTADR